MKNNVSQIDLKNIKKFITKLTKLTDEQINLIVDKGIVEFISTLDNYTINYLFRNSSSVMQNKLWSNDNIQKILIFDKTNIDNLNCNEQVIRNLENLNRVIKSQTIKKQIYNNKYFLHTIITVNKIENRFFHSYDIKKVFDSLMLNEEFNSLQPEQQLIIIEKLNSHTKELLLPIDFRDRYPNIERILLKSNREDIDETIIKQLNQEELLFLDYISHSIDNNHTIKKYIIENIKQEDKSFNELFTNIKEKDSLIRLKIQNYYKRPYYYNSITLEEKVYHILLKEIEDELIKEKLLKYLTLRILKNSTINQEIMYNTLKRNLNNNILNYKDINLLTSNYNEVDKDLKLMFYLKFNIAMPNARYMHGITLEQLSKINVKHINKLSKFLEDKTQDELSSIYGLCIKMYFIFGYERSIEILSSKFGEYNRTFLDNVAKTNISKIKMKEEGNKYLPVIDKNFINFMFETPKKNHFINMLNNKDSELYKMWYYLYNNYDEILEKCHNEITLKKVTAILETEKYDVDRKIITPNNYLLNNNSFLENIILGNKTHNSNNEVLKTIVDIYSKMKKRTEATIPYIKGVSSNGYKYEMMKLDDIQIFELGYKANCCIRTLDIAHKHLLHAALCKNGRILIIYDKLGDIAAFCPLKRNGNVLITNSIECIDKKIDTNGHLISTAYKEAIDEIINITNKTEEPISLACIGHASYLKPTVVSYPEGYRVPTIFEKNDEQYKNTDIYHKKLDIVYKENNFNFENIKSYDPKISYQDPREEIKYINFDKDRYNITIEEPINVINAINYEEDKENYTPINKYLLKEVYYSKDWYIANTYQGIIGKYLENDYRAKEEFDIYMNLIKEEPKILKRII